MSEMFRRKKDEEARLYKLVEACREAGFGATSALRVLLNEHERKENMTLAKHLGKRLTAKLPLPLADVPFDRLWLWEQDSVRLPDVAFELEGDRLQLYYRNDLFQEHSAEQIKRRFESAVRRQYPNVKVEWIEDQAGAADLSADGPSDVCEGPGM